MAEKTIEALKKLKVDCLYKKSTHFNAARRVQKEANIFRFLLIAGAIVASFSTIMNVGLWDKIEGDTTIIQIGINVLGALGGFLILYATAFSDYKSKIEMANKHENVATDLNLIFKRIRNTEAKYLDELISNEELSKNLDELTQAYINKCASAPITKNEDYLLTRENVEKGYTTDYTEKELNS